MNVRQQEWLAEKIVLWRDHPSVMVRELFGVEPDNWQEEALETYAKAPRLAFKSAKGPGKGHRVDLIIDSPVGPRRWGDLTPGDLVFAEDGSPTRVTAVHPLGVQPTFKVVFDDGSSTVVTGDHLWKVKDQECRYDGLGWMRLTTAEILKLGVTVSNGRWQGKVFTIPQQGPAQYAHADLPLDPYLVGVWIGDGTKGLPQYSKPYVEIEEEINRRGYETRRCLSRGKCDRVIIKNATKGFANLECWKFGSHERFIPANYRHASVQQRQDVLRGLMDTDGCIGDDSHMEYATTSKRLAEDVVWLVRSLGGVALIKEQIKRGWYRDDDGNKVECKNCWRVTLRTSFNPFLIPHKAQRWRDPYDRLTTERYITRFIAKIEPAGEAECMCISVEHPSHCYLANDFIVTHNSSVLSWIAWNFLLTRPYPKVAATSISGDNLSDGLWSEMAKWMHADKTGLLNAMFEWSSTNIRHREHPNIWFMTARTWPKTGSSQDQANTLAGIHADYVLFLLDESGAIPDAVMAAALAVLSSGVEAHVVQAGNPTNLSGPLYRACVTNRDLWRVIEITGDPDNPKRSKRIDLQYAIDTIKEYGGRDHPYVKVNILGEFPPSSMNTLIGPDEVRAAMRRVYTPHQIAGEPKILAADIARYGDDESVVGRRQGFQMFQFKKFRNINGEEGASIVNRDCAEWEPDGVFLDGTGGWGSSWEDNLRRLGRSPISITFNASPHDKTKFENKRAEMLWDFVMWIRRGGALPHDEDLLREITEITYSIPKDVVVVEPKRDLKARLGRSCDTLDCAILTFAEPVDVKRPYARPRRPMSDYDPFEGLNEGLGGRPGVDYNPFS